MWCYIGLDTVESLLSKHPWDRYTVTLGLKKKLKLGIIRVPLQAWSIQDYVMLYRTDLTMNLSYPDTLGIDTVESLYLGIEYNFWLVKCPDFRSLMYIYTHGIWDSGIMCPVRCRQFSVSWIRVFTLARYVGDICIAVVPLCPVTLLHHLMTQWTSNVCVCSHVLSEFASLSQELGDRSESHKVDRVPFLTSFPQQVHALKLRHLTYHDTFHFHVFCV